MFEKNIDMKIDQETLEYHPRNLSAVPMELAEVISQIEIENEANEYHPRNLSAVPLELAEVLKDIEASNR